MEGIPPEDIREHEKQKSGIQTSFCGSTRFLEQTVCTKPYFFDSLVLGVIGCLVTVLLMLFI